MAGWVPTRPLDFDRMTTALSMQWAAIAAGDGEGVEVVMMGRPEVLMEYPASDNIAVADELTFAFDDEWRFRAKDEMRELYAAAITGWGLNPAKALLTLAAYWLSWPDAMRKGYSKSGG